MSDERELLGSVGSLSRQFKGVCEGFGAWQERLQAGLHRNNQASDQTIGHLEEEIYQKTREVQRVALEEAPEKAERDYLEKFSSPDRNANGVQARRDP